MANRMVIQPTMSRDPATVKAQGHDPNTLKGPISRKQLEMTDDI